MSAFGRAVGRAAVSAEVAGRKKAFSGTLPAEPKALVALAKPESMAAANAKKLRTQLKWPGKTGATAAAAREFTAAERTQFGKGRAQLATLCATCHQPNGQGLAGLAQSLLDSRSVLCGKVQKNMTMPPWKAALNDEAIAGVLTFVRRSWGHEADPVAIAAVAEARRDTEKREEPWSDPDLEDLVQTLTPAMH